MRLSLIISLAILVTGLTAFAARADRPLPKIKNQATLKECGECHMAFQPQLLPARSWRAIMKGLGDHFGEDASLDGGVAAEIQTYLEFNAAETSVHEEARKTVRSLRGRTPLRITEVPSWLHEHDSHEVNPSAWKRPDVGSKANCPACHKHAQRGYYDDD